MLLLELVVELTWVELLLPESRPASVRTIASPPPSLVVSVVVLEEEEQPLTTSPTPSSMAAPMEGRHAS
jgi:hypothetical protein